MAADPDSRNATGGRRSPVYWFIGLTVLALLAALLLPAVKQPLDYHDFADHRHAHGIDNFLDVVSNAGFLIFGVMGLLIIGKGRACFERPAERWPYITFFIGLVLTAVGSGYYHLAPDNETLFWDRLPMTIAFMGLVAGQIVDRISVRAGLVLLPPALLIGAASVIYWLITERLGAGNVIPYGILQAYTVLVVLLLAIVNPSRYTRGSDIYWVFAWYALAKVLETFDVQVLEFSGLVSGHTLKHVAAAFAGFSVGRMLSKRTLREAGRD
jgi:hypothetical protein